MLNIIKEKIEYYKGKHFTVGVCFIFMKEFISYIFQNFLPKVSTEWLVFDHMRPY